ERREQFDERPAGVDRLERSFRAPGGGALDAWKRRQEVRRNGRADAEDDRLKPTRIRHDVVRRARGNDAALVDDGDAVAERLCLVEQVSGQEDRMAVVLHAADLPVQNALRLGIETGR